jgi:hypothetical protein
VCVDQKSVNIPLATPLGKKDQVAKTFQSNLSQMGALCDLDMKNIVTASLEDLSPEEQQKFKALQEYMQVQFLAGVKKDRSGKVARLKEFELPAIRLNDSNIEVIPTVIKKPPPDTTPTKSTVGIDELLASYIARLERLEDLEKDRALGFNNNDANSSTPKASLQGSHPSLAPFPVNNDNLAYGLTPNPASGQYPQFQPYRPNMATPVGPMQGTGQIGAMELVSDQPLPKSVMPNQMVPTFPNSISNVGHHYSTTINASPSKNIILYDVFESYRLAQAKIAAYLNKVNLENTQPP